MFVEIKPEAFDENPFNAIYNKSFLITPTTDVINPMTGGWGGFGVMWNQNIVFVVIRPVRYTYELIEKTDKFTITFFGEQYIKILNYCGSKSGKEVDKIKEIGLTPIFEDGFIYYKEATYALFCNKIYFSDIDPKNFLDPSIEKFYPKKDYHRLYMGGIVRIKKKQ